MLVIGIGSGCKRMQSFLAGFKEYMFSVRFGILTDSLDMNGNILREEVPPKISQQELESQVKLFKGESLQIPPKYQCLILDFQL